MSEQSHDIEKYLSGKLTPAEMHALEKRALDDPFLADALEGASQFSQNDLSADLQSLHKALSERADEKKVISLWVWTARIAAGLILIAISTFVIINLTKDSKKEDLALAEEQKVDAPKEQNAVQGESAARQPDSASTESNVASHDDNDREEAKAETLAGPPKNELRRSEPATPASKPTQQQQVATLRSPEPKTDSLKADVVEIADAVPAEEKENASGYIDFKAIEKEDASRRKAKSIAVNPSITQDGVYSKDRTTATPAPTAGYNYSITERARRDSTGIVLTKVTGRVTSADDGTGLPGVNVVIKGTSTGTVTDINGNYQIEIPDPYGTLVYSFIGLESMEMPVNNTSVVDASMQQDVAQLSEVVVTGFGESESAPAYPTFQMAEPMGGRRAFKKYLEDKLIYPQQAIANNVEGKVTIQFIVEPTGKLSNFNVVKGIGSGCDEELIRLIKQGPKWSATKRNDELVKSRVRVRMRFSLPKKK